MAKHSSIGDPRRDKGVSSPYTFGGTDEKKVIRFCDKIFHEATLAWIEAKKKGEKFNVKKVRQELLEKHKQEADRINRLIFLEDTEKEELEDVRDC